MNRLQGIELQDRRSVLRGVQGEGGRLPGGRAPGVPLFEFGEQQIPFAEKPRLRLECRGRKLKQQYEPGFLCFHRIIVEIKAVKQLANQPLSRV